MRLLCSNTEKKMNDAVYLLQNEDFVERLFPSQSTSPVGVDKLQVIHQIRRPLKNDTVVAAFPARGSIHMSSSLKVEKYLSTNSSDAGLRCSKDTREV